MLSIPQMFYLSDILGSSVYDSQDREIGRLHDIAVYIGPAFPPVTKIRIKKGRQLFFVRWSQVMGMERQNLILRGTFSPSESPQLHEQELLLWRNVLDKQIMDVSGRKIVRVNDITLGTIRGGICVTGVAIGFVSVLRRLGFMRVAQFFAPKKLRDHVVPWESVVPLHWTARDVQLKVQIDKLSKLHAADLARILGEVSPAERSILFDSLDDETVADVIEEFEPREQAQMLESIDGERVADVVGKMEPDDAADMLQELSPEEMADILEQMEEDEADDVRELMQHERDSAGGLMTTDFVALPEDLTATDVLDEVRGRGHDLPVENIYSIFATDEQGTLKGVANLRDVILADPTAKLSDIMNMQPVVAQLDDDAADAARLVARYDLLALPVVQEGRLVGIITVDDALDVLLPPGWKEYLPHEH